VTLRGDARLVPVAMAVALLALAGGGVTAGLAYETSPLMPLVVAGGLVALVFALAMPLRLVYLAILLVPFKLYTIDLTPAGFPPGAGLSIQEALFVLSGVAWAFGRVARGKWPFAPSPLGKPYALLLLAIVPGILLALHPFPVVKMLVMWTAFVLVYQMIVAEGKPETVHTMLLSLAVAAAVVGLKAVIAPGGDQPPQLLGIGEAAEGRPGGAFDDPNVLATFEALGLPAAVALALGRNMLLRAVGTVSFGLIVAGLSLSLSRGGFLAAAGALAVMLAWRPFRYAGLAALVVFVAFQSAAGGHLFGHIEQTSLVEGRLQSVSYAAAGGDPRFAIWRTTPEMIAAHPFFGIGANQFPEVSLRYGLFTQDLRGSYQHAHNIPLNIAAELGLVGLTAFLWATFALARVLLGAARRLAGYERGVAVAIGAAFVGLALQGMVDYTVSSNTIAAVTFVLAGCAVAMWRSAAPPQPAADAASR
jgi:putative inorganic carbon (hco3(-)) transporter